MGKIIYSFYSRVNRDRNAGLAMVKLITPRLGKGKLDNHEISAA